METVIDSVSINHLLRKPKKFAGKKKPSVATFRTGLDVYIRDSRLKVVLDADRVLQSEWEDTCGEEQIRVLITYWSDLNGLRLIKSVPSLAPQIVKQLRQLGFTGTVDKYIIRLTTVTTHNYLVSDDGDF